MPGYGIARTTNLQRERSRASIGIELVHQLGALDRCGLIRRETRPT